MLSPEFDAQQTTPKGVRRIQRTTILLLFLAGIVNFLDRGSLSIANLAIRHDLHLSGTQIGLLASVFSFSYGLAQLPIGAWLDRFGARILLGTGLLVWSGAQAATAFVGGYSQFLPLRILLGVGEAPFFPAGIQSIKGWFPQDRRGRPTGVMNASTMLGQAIAPPILTGLMLSAGWRAMFGVIGLAGILLALAWFPLYRDPKSVQLAEQAFQQKGEAREWVSLFRSRNVWGMVLGFSGINYTGWLYLTWLPNYLEVERHVSVARTGVLAALPFLLGALGMYSSGFVSDVLTRHGRDPLQTRKSQIVVGMVLSAAFTFLVPNAATALGAVWLVGGALFCVHFAGTAAWGLVQFSAPSEQIASVASIQNFGSFMVATIAPVLTGIILDRTHSFRISLLICSAVTLAGAAAYAFLVRGPIRAKP